MSNSRDIFSARRAFAILQKEFMQLVRDRLTLRMIVMLPIVQLLLFGYALNNDPKHLPTLILAQDHSVIARSIVAGLENTEYFDIVGTAASESEARHRLKDGEVQFIVSIPSNFYRDLVRGDRPQLLVEADATDPVATSGALGAVAGMLDTVLRHDLKGPLARLLSGPAPVDLRLHRMYNPEGFTRYNIIPGLIAIILTMTGVMMTALAVTRERERGTMENLLSMPVRPLEVMIGKVMPYVMIGFIQAAIIILVARLLFNIPIVGSLALFTLAITVFITCNIAMGFTLSAAARNQTQALQMSIMITLPSIMLSGFLFPFRGMPEWAQIIGVTVPATHFIRISRGILLKGSGWPEIWPDFWPMILFMAIITLIAVKRYRQTLD